MSTPEKTANPLEVDCCVVGGGPGGMMLGLLLARAGVSVAVLEKHGDFLRDFRGDTIHPSTLQVMYELGILDDFLKLSHRKVSRFSVRVSGKEITIADFSRIRVRCPYIAFLPQWDFLDFLAERGRRYPGFQLLMNTEAVDLIREGERIAGVKALSPAGPIEIRARLTVGADGRHSTVRERAGLGVRDSGAPIDVLWTRISRKPSDPPAAFGNFERGRILVLLDRGDYYQMGFVIQKGSYDELRKKGIEAFRAEVLKAAPFLAEQIGEIRVWDEIKLLTVKVDHLRRWFEPGLICIGDAAHAMSPVGGIGINLAIQDAVAAANLFAAPLRNGTVLGTQTLQRLQRRREFPARVTQQFQIYLHRRLLGPAVGGKTKAVLPFPLGLVVKLPGLRRLPAHLIGVGVRPEHVHTVDILTEKPEAGAIGESRPRKTA